jgi:alkanesulfonate monooxygenase SsuD/methylene tetrahydromethanopterin reductase-like flavin-dependent oxidoreductase (luciferase family)
MARRHTEVLLEVLRGEGFAKPNPQPMFPNPPGCCDWNPIPKGCASVSGGAPVRMRPQYGPLLGMNLQSSTLKDDETGEPFHIQQAKQIRAYRQAWKEAGHTREPRVSVSRSIFALMDDRDRMYFGASRNDSDSVGYLDEKTRAIFGRSYAAEPDKLIEQLKKTRRLLKRIRYC